MSQTLTIGSAPETHVQGKRLAALILLGGGVRPTELSKAVGRNLLDLPIHDETSLLGHWANQAADLCDALGLDRLPVRILLDEASSALPHPASAAHVDVTLELDPSKLRGTGGVLHDVCERYDPEDVVLVANASQVLLWPLTRIYNALVDCNSSAAIAVHQDGFPATLMLLRCRCLRDLPPMGFVDMKEQALPLIGQRHLIKAVKWSERVCCGVRTAEGYIDALRALCVVNAGRDSDAFAEHWRSDFQLVEQGATVEAGVRLHNSVVLGGATIGRNAVLANCVVCPGAVVPPEKRLVEKLVSPAGVRSIREEAE